MFNPNPNIEFCVARTVIPPDGYTRNPRRHEVPTELLAVSYAEFITTLPHAQRANHLQRMLFQRPRLAAKAVRLLGNRRMANERAMQRYRIEMLQWGEEQEALVSWAIQWRFTIVMDENGIAYPPMGDPQNPRPVCPPVLP